MQKKRMLGGKFILLHQQSLPPIELSKKLDSIGSMKVVLTNKKNLAYNI
jgi:hypothetical protein